MESATGDGTSVMKIKVMVINTKELKKLFDDKDFDGITLQFSQAFGNSHILQFIAYKHFSSRKKQEQITDPGFFVNDKGNDLYKEIEISEEGVTSHFGNLKLTRVDMKEDIDTDEFPYLILSPQHGTGEYENYIICNPFYSNEIKESPAPVQALSRGVPAVSSLAIKTVNPSPPG